MATGLSTRLIDQVKSWAENPGDTSQKADLTLQDGGRSFIEAVAIRDNRFLAVGTEKEVKAYWEDRTRLTNLSRCTVIPGINAASGCQDHWLTAA